MKAYSSLTKKHIQKIFKPRKAASHKGDHGHALLVAGNKGKMGAAVIAAKACLRTGPGLLTVMIPQEERSILQAGIPEAMLCFREDINDISAYNATGIGPAIGTDAAAKAILKRILSKTTAPIQLDADAITILAHGKELFDHLPVGSVITPHPKEFDRLFGGHENEETRRTAAVKFAAEKNIVIVLKGHHTLITNGDQTFLNSTGNAGLAKGGSGDALTGIITALLAQGYSSFNAALLGVYLHGLAADLALKKQSLESMLVTDVIEMLGKAFQKIGE